jgi:hypothetical protein
MDSCLNKEECLVVLIITETPTFTLSLIVVGTLTVVAFASCITVICIVSAAKKKKRGDHDLQGDPREQQDGAGEDPEARYIAMDPMHRHIYVIENHGNEI